MDTNVNTKVDFGTNNSNTNTSNSIGSTPNNNQSTYQNATPTNNNVQTESMDLSFATEQVATESKSIIESIGDFFSDLGEGLKNTGAAIVDGTKAVANWAINGLKDLGSTISEACTNLASNVSSILGSAYSWAKDTYIDLKATEAVIATTIISGIADIGEGIVDGLAWTGGKLVEGGSWLVGKVAGWFSDDAEEAVMDWRSQANTDVKEFIAHDWVGEANDWFYQETSLGRFINENSYLKYDSEAMQKLRGASEMVGKLVIATAASCIPGGAVIVPLLLGFTYGTGNAAENTYATKGTNTSTLDELLILANGGLSALSWYTSGQLGKGFLEIGKAMSDASIQEILAQMAKEVFSKDMLKELLKPGNLVGNAVGTLMQTGGDIALIATKIYNGQDVTPEEWSVLVGELIVYFGLNMLEDALTTEITGFKTNNTEVIKTTAEASPSKISDNELSTEEISKYIDEYMMDPDKTPPMGIPVALIEFMEKYKNDPYATMPNGIPPEIINYLNAKTSLSNIEFESPTIFNEQKITELSPEVQEFLEKIKKNSPINAQNMKYEIMKSAEGLQDPTLIAKKLYNELNKRVNYNVDYMDMAYGDTLPTAAMDIYMKPVSFDSIDSNQVICKGWSELYKELLLEAGYKPEQIQILGGSKIGAHKWVSIDLGNGSSIVADATNAIKGKTDLYSCKIGETTQGFLVVPTDIIGQRISSPINFYKWYETQEKGPEYLAQMKEYIKNIDANLNSNGESAQIQKAQRLFSDDSLLSEIMMESPESYLATNILNNPISQSTGIDGLEAYVYYRNAIRNILGNGNNGTIKNELYKPKGISNYESVNIITINADNGPIYQIYSKNTGRIIIDSQEQFLEFIKNFDLVLG